MRRMRRIADEDDVLVKPGLVLHADERRPWRAQMARVGHQPVPGEPPPEQLLTRGDRSLEIEPVEARVPPRPLIALDDERGGALIEAIAVRLEHAVFVFDEIERECFERKRGAEPDVSGRPHVEVGLEMRSVPRAHRTVHAVGGDDQIQVSEAETGQVALVGDFRLGAQRHAESGGSLLQDVQEPPAGDARESVAARRDHPSMDVDVDVVPMGEARDDLIAGLRISGAEVL